MEKEIYIVDKIIEEAKDVKTLCFVPESGEKMVFTAGQFLRVDLVDNLHNLSNKPYSISSTPKDSFLSISVKKIGAFSGALHALKVGDKVEISGPFGSMATEDTMEKMVFIAGGIGIAPFKAMIKDLYERGETDKEIYLFYSNKTKEDIAFLEQLKKMEEEWSGLRVVYILTQEKEKMDEVYEYSRLDAQMLKKYVHALGAPNYFLCGSVPFVTEISKILETENINEEQISAELFY
ncbi:ferredoxin--NADP reductase [Patescibacteria group bacterium]